MVITDNDGKWFVIFSTLSTTFLLIMFVYPNLNTVFLVLASFFLFLFLVPLSTFSAKRTLFKVLANEDISEDFCAAEIVGASLGGSPSIGPSKVLNF